MDLKIIVTVFISVFLAELGDKTQIATMGFSATNSQKWSVFIGSSLALVSASAIGVIVGSYIEDYIPLKWVERIGGILFILIGIFTLFKSFKN